MTEDKRRLKELQDSIDRRIIALEAQVEIAKARLRRTAPAVAIVIFNEKGKQRGERENGK